jgi:indole-3-glycerol phosphate synthase
VPREFLEEMARVSARRAERARAREPEAALRRRAADTPPPPRLALHPAAFDLIAEVKRRTPRGRRYPVRPGAVDRARAYARGGAAAVSVLTEPTRFGGSLAHLAAVARVIDVPAMRKDFLVDPYQVFEARAAGAGGALLILRILSDARLSELLEAARACSMFVLLEAFDETDLARAGAALASCASPVLVGLNARDLATLATDGERHARLRPAFPRGSIRVAESGLGGPADAGRVAALGYRLALSGAALMDAADPTAAVGAMLRAGRSAARTPCEPA